MLALQGSLCSKDSNEGGVVLDNTNSTTTEVLRLKDALRRLQALYEAEKLVTVNQKARLDDLDYRAQNQAESILKLESQLLEAEEQVHELSQQVDDSSGFAEMVETLTATNEELNGRVIQLKEESSDLESAVELSEEIDAAQRAEIAALRYGHMYLVITQLELN